LRHELDERWEPKTEEESQGYKNCILCEVAVQRGQKELDGWCNSDLFTLEGYAIESENLTVALKARGLSQGEMAALATEKSKMAAAMKELRQTRDKLKGKLKVRRSLLRDFKKKDKNSKKALKRLNRRLRAAIEEDILTPLILRLE
jgi:hypothetical protein